MTYDSDHDFPPCVGCGYCCMKALCPLGSAKHGYEIPCPSLVLKDGRYWCGEVLSADDERRPLIEWDLAIAAGCCSSLNTQRRRQMGYSKVNGHGYKPVRMVLAGIEVAALEMMLTEWQWPTDIPQPEVRGIEVLFPTLETLVDCVNRLNMRGHVLLAGRIQEAFLEHQR